ncbi:hypothetical protein [Spiroplasma alleghenense]|uniref:Uncharacterized protein n=1 Tax=Spiroplasma alleghenense TaxID=216931 RepID=A0A345Z4L3_9MOLU|nr:hypothetical protein [Spiroplasma alleghenense]AXK51542.1 hypothetical protein SALLE_v1c08720 [Spiroplasma alleghenense]
MGKDTKYRIAKNWNIVNIVIISLGTLSGIFMGFLMMIAGATGWGILTIISVIGGAIPLLIMPIILQVTLKKDLKNGCPKVHNAMAICALFFAAPFGLIVGLFILLGDVDTAPISSSSKSSELL